MVAASTSAASASGRRAMRVRVGEPFAVLVLLDRLLASTRQAVPAAAVRRASRWHRLQWQQQQPEAPAAKRIRRGPVENYKYNTVCVQVQVRCIALPLDSSPAAGGRFRSSCSCGRSTRALILVNCERLLCRSRRKCDL